ncbi:MAG: hypothetical protein GX237_05530 [Clostridiales bacterium]|nr:hypothetical protein [Clostridiales bacterium]
MLTERTLERYSDSYLMDVDTELMMPDVISFPKQKLYFTENYLVCSTNGFNIVPWDEIEQIYGMAFKKLGKDYRSIVVKINDGVDYEIVSTKFDKEGEDLFDQIMSYIYNRKPEIKYGFDDGFYIETVSGFSMEALIGETEAGIRNNYLLGILGAILWSFVGVIIWIAIGKLGLIAGIAGYLMMKFAIYGYRRFSGGINRKGKIISLLISLLMIFVANYLLYVIEMSTYYYGNVFSITNIIKSIVNLPGFLSFTNLWGDFVKDLVIGYGLSLWAGFQIIKEVFRR